MNIHFDGFIMYRDDTINIYSSHENKIFRDTLYNFALSFVISFIFNGKIKTSWLLNLKKATTNQIYYIISSRNESKIADKLETWIGRVSIPSNFSSSFQTGRLPSENNSLLLCNIRSSFVSPLRQT